MLRPSGDHVGVKTASNSSLSGGRPNGFVSRRLHVWRETDPDRTGLLPFVYEPDFGYRRGVGHGVPVVLGDFAGHHPKAPAHQ